jgi:hypothetical protein
MLNGFDVDLAADATRLTNRLRNALTSISPSLERAGVPSGALWVRDLLVKYPTPSARRRAGRTRITTAVKKRSPRRAAKVADTVIYALDAQTLIWPAEATEPGDCRGDQRARPDLYPPSRARGRDRRGLPYSPFRPAPRDPARDRNRTGARTSPRSVAGTRFAKGSKLASYAGLAPVTRQSAKTPQRRVHEPTGQPPPQESSSSPPSPPCVTPNPARSATANEPSASTTTPRSCASPAAAAM